MRGKRIEIIGLYDIPMVKAGDDLGAFIVEAAERIGAGIRDGDVVVVAQVAVSKAEGRTVKLSEAKPSSFAEKIARETGKDPRHVELILRESKRIVRMRGGIIISETVKGIVCANAGVDLSNVGEGRAALLPKDPDESAKMIRERIRELTGAEVAVIVADTHGRPLRKGAINVAIGCSGLSPLLDRRGEKDFYGRILRSKIICVADELASAAELVMGQADEGIPAAIIRGYSFKRAEIPASVIPRREEDDLFF